MNPNRLYQSFTLFALSLLLLSGCRELDPSGVYQGNKVLYNADQTITSAYDLMHSFVLWEYQNRASLPPEVTRAANAVRDNAQSALKSAIAAREAYASHPNDGTAAQTLQTAIATLSAVLTQVQHYLPSK